MSDHCPNCGEVLDVWVTLSNAIETHCRTCGETPLRTATTDPVEQLAARLARLEAAQLQLHRLLDARYQDIERLCEAVFGSPLNEHDTGPVGLAVAVDQWGRKLERMEEDLQSLRQAAGRVT